MNFLGAAWGWLTDPANWEGTGGIPNRLVEHLGYVGRSLLIAGLIALPLGLLTGHRCVHIREGFRRSLSATLAVPV